MTMTRCRYIYDDREIFKCCCHLQFSSWPSLETMRRFFRRRCLALFFFICVLFYVTLVSLSGSQTRNTPRSIDASIRQFFKTTSGNVTFAPVAKRLVHDVRCDEIMKGSKSEISKAKLIMESKDYKRKAISENDYIQMTKNCDNFKRVRDYSTFVTKTELSVPVAYSILLFKDVEQAERLLRAIYSPVNSYCFHIDADSDPSVHKAVESIARCFDNVFVVSRKEYVVYAGFSRLQADLNCMSDLLHNNRNWKYFINLPSQQFPLKTNAEIAKILNIYNGANDIEGLTGGRRLPNRFAKRYVVKPSDNHKKPHILQLNQKKEDPPYNVTIVKGSAYGIFSRDFVDFVTNSKIARVLLDWFRDVYSPDEYYWATLNYNHHINTPGSFYHGKPDDKPWLAVYANWMGKNPCSGKFVRGVCVYGAGDLHSLTLRKELFANKLYLDFQPLALDCLEEWHRNRTSLGEQTSLNITYYENLPFINRPNR